MRWVDLGEERGGGEGGRRGGEERGEEREGGEGGRRGGGGASYVTDMLIESVDNIIKEWEGGKGVG